MNNADAARMDMIRRMRHDGRENVPPEVNGGLDMTFFMDLKRREGLLSLCDDPDLKDQLQAAAWKVWATFGNQISRKYFTGLFLFNASEQEGAWAECDGMACRYGTEAGQIAYKIGIATSAVESGEDCLLLTLIHEAAHVVHWTYFGHESEWHALLDQMIREFNSATGYELENDYSSFNGEGGWRTTPGQPWIRR